MIDNYPTPAELRAYLKGKAPRRNKGREMPLVKACLNLLKLNGIFAWRNNTGATPTQYKGRKGFVRYGRVGSGDIFAILPGGVFCSVEVKTDKGVVSEHQIKWLDDVRAAGAQAFVVFGLHDLIFELRCRHVPLKTGLEPPGARKGAERD